MKKLNFTNVEELIFHDRSAQRRLDPHHFSHFEMWRLAQRMPMLRATGKQSVLDFLNGLTDEDQRVLEEYFGEKIVIERLNYSIVLETKTPLNECDICEELCQVEGYNEFTTWRDDEFLYITHWR